MNYWKSNSMIRIAGLLLLSLPAMAQRGPGGPPQGSAGGNGGSFLIDTLPLQALDPMEKEGLLFMREEEKLAHDVYTKLFEKWNASVFDRIADSEQRHTDSIQLLLDRYGLTDPVGSNGIGVFRDARLTTIYNDLMKKGAVSFTEALKVGATIEDLDIRDLDQAIAATDNTDLKYIYDHLRSGSYNHIRAFVSQLKTLGITYTAQYISQAALDEILAGNGRNGRW